MSKRIIAAVLSAIMLFSLFPVLSLATENETAVLTVEQVDAKPGEIVDVNINIANNPGILGARISVSWPEALTLIDSANGSAFAKLNYQKPSKYVSGCNFTWYGTSLNTVLDGTILTLTFQISETAEDEDIFDITVAYDSENITDENWDVVNLTVNQGNIRIVTYIPGDVSGDGRVNTLDLIMLAQYISDGGTNPDGFNVTINERAADVNDDGRKDPRDLILISRYISDGCKTDPAGFNVTLKPYTHRCRLSAQAIAAKEPGCEEDGNIAYWYCTKCDKYFLDSSASSEITRQDTVIAATGHSYADVWSSDEGYHWHGAICEHSEAAKDKAAHSLDANGLCTICNHSVSFQLAQPVITAVKYDTIYWDPVPNANEYMVRVEDNYTCTLRGTQCLLKDLDWNGKPLSNIEKGFIKVEVMALGHGYFKASPWSEVDTSYYYVAEANSSDKANLNSLKIGYGYNLIEDAYLDITESSTVAVFDHDKLLALGDYSGRTPASSGAGATYRYSSMDEFLSKTNEEYNAKLSIGTPFLGTLSMQLEAGVGSNSRNYSYVETLVYIENKVYADYKIQNITPSEYVHCLSDKFLKDLRCESDETKEFADNPEALAEYIYNTYGTHAILGVTTGGAYYLQYMIATNETSIANEARAKFDATVKSGEILSKIFSLECSAGFDLSQSNSYVSENTSAKLIGYYYGGNGRTPINANDANNAIAAWSEKFGEDTAVSIALTKDGAIDLVSLIGAVRPDFAATFEAYVNSKADESYRLLNEEFSAETANTFMSVVDEDGENVLRIDLSAYQAAGSLERINSAYLLNNILTVYPVMQGKHIDRIHVIGGFDRINGQKLIDNLSISLSEQWKRNVEIVVENLGVICNSNQGLIDTAKLGYGIHATVTYQGINVLQQTSGDYHVIANADGTERQYIFSLTEGHSLDLTSARIEDGKLYLPVVDKEYYDFNGWKDLQTGEILTNHLGQVTASGSAANVNLTATWVPTRYKITLDNQQATTAGTDILWEQYTVGFFYNDMQDTEQKHTIVVPQRTGYVFGGYYTAVENNSEVTAAGVGDPIIDAQGNILVSPSRFTQNTTLVACWTPRIVTVTLDNQSATADGTAAIYQQYKTGFFADAEAAQTLTEITVPEREGYHFAGYYLSVMENGTNSATGTDMVIDAEGRIVMEDFTFANHTTLYALWTGNYTIKLDNQNADVTTVGDVAYYEKYGVGIYGDIQGIRPVTKITVPVREDYIFDGYYESVSQNGTIYAEGTNQWIAADGTILADSTTFGQNKTLYAKWIRSVFHIQYETLTQDATHSVPVEIVHNNPSKFVYGGVLSFSDPVRSEYDIFQGWYADAAFTVPVDEAWIENWYINPENITLYAKWNLAVYYNTLESTPVLSAIGDRTRVFVDWSGYSAGIQDYVAAIDTNNDGIRDTTGGNTNLDIRAGVTQVYFIGNSNTTFDNVNIYTVHFDEGVALTIHFENFNFIGRMGSWYNDTWQDAGMNLTIDCTGVNTIKTDAGSTGASTGVTVDHYQNLTITGSGSLDIYGADGLDGTSAGANGGHGQVAVNVTNLTVDMTGNLNIHGGNGGDGGIGGNGGNGQIAVNATSVTVDIIGDFNVHGGNGGDGGSGGNGGDGQTAISVTDLTVDKIGAFNVYGGNGGDGGRGSDGYDGSIGENGDNGGNGGNGDTAIEVSGIFQLNSGAVNIYGGDGGNGGSGGNGVDGNDGSDGWVHWETGINGANGIRGGNGGNGGSGGNGALAVSNDTTMLTSGEVYLYGGGAGAAGNGGNGGDGGDGGDGGQVWDGSFVPFPNLDKCNGYHAGDGNYAGIGGIAGTCGTAAASYEGTYTGTVINTPGIRADEATDGVDGISGMGGIRGYHAHSGWTEAWYGSNGKSPIIENFLSIEPTSMTTANLPSNRWHTVNVYNCNWTPMDITVDVSLENYTTIEFYYKVSSGDKYFEMFNAAGEALYQGNSTAWTNVSINRSGDTWVLYVGGTAVKYGLTGNNLKELIAKVTLGGSVTADVYLTDLIGTRADEPIK